MYRHNGKVPRDRKDVDAKIVKSIVNQYRKIYSNKQIYTALNLPKTTFYRWLNSSDKEISEDYAQNNILAKVRRKKRKFNSGATSVIVSNILKRDFIAKSPNTKWFTDITYLKFSDKTLYLSAIMDGFNGEIVAYKIADNQ